MRVRNAACSTLLTLIATVAVAAPPQLVVPGRWEITLQNELPQPTKPVSFYVCIEPGAGERPEPPKSKPSDRCQVTEGAVNGNVVSFTSKCGTSHESHVRMTYRGQQYDGVIELTDPSGKARQIVTARRVGACEDPAPQSIAGGNE